MNVIGILSGRMSRSAVATLAASSLLAPAAPAKAQPQPYTAATAVRDVTADETGYGGSLALPVGGSRVLRFTQPIGRVLIGEPKVGDVIPLSDRTLYVMGKAAGNTAITVMPRGSNLNPLATMDLRVGYDMDGLKRALAEVMPGEHVDASVRGDGVVLTGLLSSSAVAARASALAEQYAPQHVVNLTAIRGAEQVMIEVRVAEVQRQVLRQLGIHNIQALWDTTQSLRLGVPSFNPDAVASIIGRTTGGENWSIQGIFDALEQKGFATTLAEPNLVALSGETAVFFAGGEFPIPVPQNGLNGANTITIEYKQYGVSVGFTPTVYGDTINLVVAPEVSALDTANSVDLNGFRVPGVTTRRAKTTVELRNGQSFAIAGLIRREFSDNLRGLPGAASLPIFGALFRSTKYQNSETEVVIIVTAHLAQPTDRTKLIVPTDLVRAPTDAEIFLNSATDKPVIGTPRPPAPSAPVAAAGTPAATTPAPSPAPAAK